MKARHLLVASAAVVMSIGIADLVEGYEESLHTTPPATVSDAAE